MDRAEIVVHGRVQGVWFRDYVKKAADRLKLNGWVKNNPNGTVSAEVEGEKEVIEELTQLIRIGSPLSNVDEVIVDWTTSDNNYNSFQIIR